MEENVRLAYLYDFYGELLNPGQNELFATFVFEDLSLQEMAEELGISRQAVHDRIRRCIHIMEEYEAHLGLLKKYQRIQELADGIEKRLEQMLADVRAAVPTEDTTGTGGREAFAAGARTRQGQDEILRLLHEITEVL